MALFDMRNWFTSARRSKLSTRVTILFAAALVVPWFAFAWLTMSQHDEHVERTERYLAALAAAYGQHAATLIELRAQAPAVSRIGPPVWTARIEGDLAAFREALNVPNVTFTLRRPGSAPSQADMIVGEANDPSTGIDIVASMSRSEALSDWRDSASAQAIALFIRSLFVVGVGWFLVRQLRWREALERELVRQKDKAEAASRAKSEFLANMSHELRTPLNAIIGFAEIIRKRSFGPTSERYSEYASDIYNSGTHLLGLINDILSLSKLEAGKFQLQEQQVELTGTVEASLDLVEEDARQANIRLSVSLDPEALFIRADERRLRQILINLLSNAVKFTPDGGSVRVTSARRNGGLAVSVSDTGIGMAPDDIPRALAPFDQIERKVRQKQEGTGLGLPIAKQLVELHGGTLRIESEINVGTTVTFLLPPSRMIESPPSATVRAAS